MDSSGWQKACPVEVRAGKRWSDKDGGQVLIASVLQPVTVLRVTLLSAPKDPLQILLSVAVIFSVVCKDLWTDFIFVHC